MCAQGLYVPVFFHVLYYNHSERQKVALSVPY